ncbi:hypothetical protein Poli38472_009849 [Pythium oligandrum]|uniref:Uncharacterized protein n=1 Tax=Pythium oligandrum TaxID=41045 RepID=A0A8K1FH55_PYTOL|nr:hypothetical protein Poli38472_009849 [Pythium oligandrum]|eukprot:TMW62356.1 hypothetical protein Poli38472_009849 [Pythium oligandrum]
MGKITNYMRVTKRRKVHEKHEKMVERVGKKVSPAPAIEKLTVSKTKPEENGRVITYDGDELYEDGHHVPRFIFNTVKYVRRGEAHEVPMTTQKIVDYIREHYVIPIDFEQNHKYGPHSGMTYEERLLRAYKFRLLDLKDSDLAEPEVICVSCAVLGHSDKECPDGF